MTRGSRRLAVSLGLCLLVGCKTGSSGRADYDPLVGGGPIPSGVAASVPYAGRPPSSGVADARNGEVPPLTGARGPTTPASLTLGSASPGSASETSSGVTLQQPRPLTAKPGTPTATPVAAAAAAPASGNPDSYESLQQALHKRGVVWQQLNTTGKTDEWHFICAVATPSDPYLRKNYETTQVGPSGLAAMRTVLDKIDHDHP